MQQTPGWNIAVSDPTGAPSIQLAAQTASMPRHYTMPTPAFVPFDSADANAAMPASPVFTWEIPSSAHSVGKAMMLPHEMGGQFKGTVTIQGPTPTRRDSVGFRDDFPMPTMVKMPVAGSYAPSSAAAHIDESPSLTASGETVLPISF